MALKTTGVTVSQVASTLGTNLTDIGALCTHHNINKWSKYKPTIYPSVCPTMEQFYKANDGYCGFDTTTARIQNEGDTDGMVNNIWTYKPPTGGAISPYRLGDFRGYAHDARVQYQCEQSGIMYANGQVNAVPFREEWIEGSLKFTELLQNEGAGNVYICAVVKQGSYTAYGSVDISNGGNQALEITLGAQFNTGYATMYIFLSNRPCTNGSFPTDTIFWAFPDGTGIKRNFTVSIRRNAPVSYDYYNITSWNYVNCYYNYIDFEVEIELSNNAPDTVTNVSLDERYFYASYTLNTQYGIYSRDRIRSAGGEFVIISVEGAGTDKATVRGQVYLADFDTHIDYEGVLALEYSRNQGQQYDTLGGYQVQWMFGS